MLPYDKSECFLLLRGYTLLYPLTTSVTRSVSFYLSYIKVNILHRFYHFKYLSFSLSHQKIPELLPTLPLNDFVTRISKSICSTYLRSLYDVL